MVVPVIRLNARGYYTKRKNGRGDGDGCNT